MRQVDPDVLVLGWNTVIKLICFGKTSGLFAFHKMYM